MKLKLILVALTLVVTLGMVACKSNEKAVPSSSTVEVSIDDFTNMNNISRQVEVSEGDIIIVILGSNQTTGFRWTEQAQIQDITKLEQTDHRFISPDVDNQVGTGGKEEWTFKALESGTTTVAMEYSRPWEGGEKGVWTFDLTVNVNP